MTVSTQEMSTYNYMNCIRRSVWNEKASNPKLIEMELKSHKATINENASTIFSKLVENEANTKISMKCFKSQPEITYQMRSLIFDFIMCCHIRLKLSTPTLFLCFNIIDRYCSKIIVKSSTYQLLGLCSLWLASKYTDKKQKIPSLPTLQSLCCDQYNKEQFKEMELHICQSLNWTMCHGPSLDSFLDILIRSRTFQNENTDCVAMKLGALILSQLVCFNLSITFNHSPSSIALACLFITKFSLLSSRFNTFMNFETMVSNEKLDPQLVTLMKTILESINESEIPSSFRLRYYSNDVQHPVMKCLFSYKASWTEHLSRNAVYSTLLSPLVPDFNQEASPSSKTQQLDSTKWMQIPPTPSTNPSTPTFSKATKPAASLSHNGTGLSFRRHSKRDSSLMDIDFFEEETIQYAKKGRVGEC
ncbi:G1/S-specific cyclin CLN3 [Kluyveromyces marxianus]